MTKRYICYFASFMVLVEIIMSVIGMDFGLCVVWRKPDDDEE